MFYVTQIIKKNCVLVTAKKNLSENPHKQEESYDLLALFDTITILIDDTRDCSIILGLHEGYHVEHRFLWPSVDGGGCCYG